MKRYSLPSEIDLWNIKSIIILSVWRRNYFYNCIRAIDKYFIDVWIHLILELYCHQSALTYFLNTTQTLFFSIWTCILIGSQIWNIFLFLLILILNPNLRICGCIHKIMKVTSRYKLIGSIYINLIIIKYWTTIF